MIVQPLEFHSLVILIKINKQVLPEYNELCTVLKAMQMDDPAGKTLSVQLSTLLVCWFQRGKLLSSLGSCAVFKYEKGQSTTKDILT